MIYVKTKWFHSDGDMPVLFYSELDEDRSETKKIEFFKNGSVIFADSDQECEYPILSGYAYPSNEEINQDNQFEIINITKEEFYKIWEEIALYHNK